MPVRAATAVTGHAVRQLYLLAGMVDVAAETGDAELMRAAERLCADAYGTKTYVTGGQGSRHRDEAFGNAYELPPDRAYAETCAAIASFQWNWRMLLATGARRYADTMETALLDYPRTWTLALRVPQWCAAATLTADGAEVPVEEHDGYLRITRDWLTTTTVVLDLAMPPRLVTAHPYVDAVRGCVALARGPLVYCLEQADLPDGVALADVRLDPSAELRAGAAPDGAVTLTLTATAAVRPPSTPDLYTAGHPAAPGRLVDVTAIPYLRWANRAEGAMRVWIPTLERC